MVSLVYHMCCVCWCYHLVHVPLPGVGRLQKVWEGLVVLLFLVAQRYSPLPGVDLVQISISCCVPPVFLVWTVGVMFVSVPSVPPASHAFHVNPVLFLAAT